MHKLTALLKRHAVAGLVCLGIVLVLPSIAAGLFADDFFHFVLMQNPGTKPVFAFGLFNFLDNMPEKRLHLQGLSILPWWASPDLTINFFRPLSEITHVLDYRFIYPQVWLMHIHSIAWYGLLLALLSRFYRNFSVSRPAAVMALLFFAVDASHGLTVSWLANRNAIIAAVFSLVAINSHHAFRQNGLWRYYLLSIMAIALCFSASEGGIVVGVMLLAYALFMDKDGIFRGLLYLLPALLVFLCWLGIYKTYGFGASGHTYYYIDPLQDAGLFLHYFPERFLQAISIQFNILPLNFYPEFNTIVVICGAVFLLVLVTLMFGNNISNSPQKTSYRFYCFSLLLAVIPICATEIQDRNLTYVGMLGAPLLADLFLFFYRMKQRWLKYSGMGILIFFHIVLSGLMLAGISYFPKVLTKDLSSTADSLPVTHPYIISLGTPFSHSTFVTSIRTTHGLPNPQRFWNLTTSLAGITIHRTGTHTFELESKNGLFSSYDLKLRNLAVNPIHVGDRFELDGLSLKINGINAEGLPDKATVQVSNDIPANKLSLVYWTEAQRNIEYKTFTLGIGEEKTF